MQNVVLYNTDLFNEEKGLPFLKREIELGNRPKFTLGLSDPPYDENVDEKTSPIKEKTIKNYKEYRQNKKNYPDFIENWEGFTKGWLGLMLDCCEGICFTCGTKRHYDYIELWRPNYHEKYWYKSNACAYILQEPILFYGKIRNFSSIKQTIDIPINLSNEIKTEHPHPKPFPLYEYLITRIKPDSVLDCFFGSGTSGQVCLKYSIPFYAIDKEDYSNDWNKRKRQKPIKPKKQTNINKFIK
jgi:hypothetical protein